MKDEGGSLSFVLHAIGLGAAKTQKGRDSSVCHGPSALLVVFLLLEVGVASAGDANR